MSKRIRRSSPPTPAPAEGSADAARPFALLVIDHERLQAAAWAEFHTARKRLEKAARDLHRHEETDVPAYDSWLHRTFPLQLSALRELHAEVTAKTRRILSVRMQAAQHGGSHKRIWREQKAREANPEAFKREDADFDEEEEFGARHEATQEDFEKAAGPKPTPGARDIYRRLVQRLHPDRGGTWTTARAQLWHEVQRAWAAADADWLARLEVDWETANEVLSPTSALGRLRRGIEEIDAARRDTERKLREYRKAPQWRFTLREKQRSALHDRTEANFLHDVTFLRRQLDHLNATIAAWDDDWTRSDNTSARRPKRRGFARRPRF
jgi:hypothetical protein